MRIKDLMKAYTSSDYGFLDELHPKFKEDLKKIIEKRGSLDMVVEGAVGEMLVFFIPPESHLDKVIEGFDPAMIAEESLKVSVKKVFEVILEEYPEQIEEKDKFSAKFVDAANLAVGEAVYEISEGMINGI